MDLAFGGINTGGFQGFRMKNAKSWFDKKSKMAVYIIAGYKIII